MPNPAALRERRLRKTKAQLIDEIDTLEQRVATIEAANRSSAPKRAKASDRYLADQQLADLARFPSENPNPVLRVVPDGTVLYANDAANAVKGLLKGRKKLTLARDLAGVCAETSGTAEVRETELESSDRVFVFSIAPVAGETYINIYGRDITERKRAEAELVEKEAQLRLALDHMPGCMALGDRDLNYVLFSAHYSELFDFPDGLVRVGGSLRDELRYQADRGDFGPGDKEDLIEQVVAPRLRGEAVSYERAIAGSGRTLQVNVAPTPQGGYVIIATDITERKRAEEALREQTLIVELLHKTAADANQAGDAEAAMRACLDAVCAHTGWPVGHVYVRSGEVSDLLVSADIWHLDQPERFATFREVTQKTTFEPGVGLPGRTLESGKPAWVVDVTKDPNFPRARLAEEIGVRAGFAVPVLIGNRVEAVLEFFAATAVEPDEALMQVLGNIGAQVGRAVERTRAEKELAEKAAQLRVALDHMPGGMSLLDRDMNCVFFNRQYSELHDYPDGLLKLGESSHDTIRFQAERGDYGPGNKDELVEQVLGLYQGGKATSWERTITGSGRMLRFNMAPTPNGGYVTIARDITKRKQAEEALRKSQHLLQTVLDHMPAPVYLRDADSRFMLINRRYEEIHRVMRDDTRGKTLHEVFSDERAVDDGTLDREVIKQRRVLEREETYQLWDGEHTLAVIRFPIFDPFGEVVAVGGVDVDITERKRAEDELAEKEAQLRVALDHMPGGMALGNRDLNYVLFNARYCELFELPEGLTRVGGSIRDVLRYQADRGDFGPGDQHDHIEQVVAIYRRGEAVSFERAISGSGVRSAV
jgi:PAS domain S-box-containing protein